MYKKFVFSMILLFIGGSVTASLAFWALPGFTLAFACLTGVSCVAASMIVSTVLTFMLNP